MANYTPPVSKANAKKKEQKQPNEKEAEGADLNFAAVADQARKNNKRKKSFNGGEEHNEFQHWNAFLETDQIQQGDDEDSTHNHNANQQPRSQVQTQQQGRAQMHQQQQQQQQQQQPEDTTLPPILSRNRKKRKVGNESNVTVDPELAQLDDPTDHEQLVRAAILDANQLAEDANANIQDYIEHPQDENEPKLNQSLDSSIIQAAQAAAAALVAAANNNQEVGARQGQQQQHEPTAQQSHANQTQEPLVQNRPRDIIAGTRGPIQVTEQTAAMVAAAAEKASDWVQNQRQGKMFSKEESEAINKFITDFCAIHGMTREDICVRVWSNERKKDDFWDLIHKVLPYRTRASVYKHVRRTYHVFQVRGKWTPEEDKTLARLATEKDGQWKVIGQEMNRMPEDCRDRWRNYVKCGVNRAQNKWSAKEEDVLKQIIAEIVAEQESHGITTPVINWTVVSDKMGGARSRIQCRYKWNKLLKRDALARAQTIDNNDRVWILTKLQEFRFHSEDDIQWDHLADLHPKHYWSGKDFQLCYEKMRSSIRDHRKKSVNDICQLLLQDLIADANRTNSNIGLAVVLQDFHKNKADQSATSIASAAVNASIENSQTQGYIQNHDSHVY